MVTRRPSQHSQTTRTTPAGALASRSGTALPRWSFNRASGSVSEQRNAVAVVAVVAGREPFPPETLGIRTVTASTGRPLESGRLVAGSGW
jgi:hypothetical protein